MWPLELLSASDGTRVAGQRPSDEAAVSHPAQAGSLAELQEPRVPDGARLRVAGLEHWPMVWPPQVVPVVLPGAAAWDAATGRP